MCNDPDLSFDLDRFAPYRLAVAAQRVSDALARIYRDRFGIRVPEWRVLAHLSAAGGDPVSVRDIEARVGLEKSTVSRAASRLEVAGHIEKRQDARDGRLVALRLTPKGHALMADLLPQAAAFQKAFEAQLGADYAALDRGLQAILDAP